MWFLRCIIISNLICPEFFQCSSTVSSLKTFSFSRSRFEYFLCFCIIKCYNLYTTLYLWFQVLSLLYRICRKKIYFSYKMLVLPLLLMTISPFPSFVNLHSRSVKHMTVSNFLCKFNDCLLRPNFFGLFSSVSYYIF